ncbi:MAG: UvrD-helicase domain-containing protein [Bacillota bacterium]|nr:UvrD-helicase domain-containing protein [Bacillota bacterium]
MNENMLDTLNKNQREAATTIDQHVRIVAGAGSGKTRVLMARIAYLIEEIGVFPNRIMAITFTNKATNEMKERLKAIVGEEAQRVRISTIHSLCVRLLREDGEKLGYPKGFTIFDVDDQKQVLRPIYKSLDIDQKAHPMPRVLGYISANKSAHVDPDQAANMAMGPDQELHAKVYRSYEKRRKEMMAMDFDDLLLEAQRLLRTDLSVREKWQRRLDYIHVDEFQDVDPVQYSIVCMLTGKDTILCVVGDPDQTIYTWRGASVDIILKFNQDFPNSKTIILDQNYRSTKPILDASNALITHNKNRIKKDLYTNIENGKKLVIKACLKEEEEAIYLARSISDHKKKGVAFKDMAILYRSNYSSRIFERVLRKINIPYIIYGGIRFYERQEIKDALSYLKLCTLPSEDDPKQLSLDLAILRVINMPKRSIGAKTIEVIREQAQERDINMLDVLRDPIDLSPSIVKKCKGFVELIDRLRSHRNDYSLEDYLDYVLEESGYIAMLQEEKEEERLGNLAELKADIAASLAETPDMTLEEYLQNIALFTDKSEEKKTDHVSLMTVHAAKGLEFDIVYIVNFNESIFPSARAVQEAGNSGLEEERRLAYVAMTRARKELYISYNADYSYMLNMSKTPSRFIMEIPKECVEQPEKPKTTSIPSAPVSSASAAIAKANTGKKGAYKKNDLVEHSVYGPGVVIKVEGNVLTVAFKSSVGVKKLNGNHPSIKKV